MSRLRLDREFYEPKIYQQKLDHAELKLVIYIVDDKHALGFKGKQTRPVFNYLFVSRQRMKDFIDRFIASERLSLERHKAFQASKKIPALRKYLEGYVVVHSWGYDQTNIDFYKITKRSGSFIWLKKMTSEVVKDTGWAQADVIPGRVISNAPTLKRKVHTRDGEEIGVSVTSSGWGYLWDGKPAHETSYA